MWIDLKIGWLKGCWEFLLKSSFDAVWIINLGVRMPMVLIRMGTLHIVRRKNFSDDIEYA